MFVELLDLRVLTSSRKVDEYKHLNLPKPRTLNPTTLLPGRLGSVTIATKPENVEQSGRGVIESAAAGPVVVELTVVRGRVVAVLTVVGKLRPEVGWRRLNIPCRYPISQLNLSRFGRRN